jgi:Holliday junction DNA helicase RuvB
MFDVFDLLGISQILELAKESFGFKVHKEEEIKPVKYMYRPQKLIEYIGQERAKDLVQLNLDKIKYLKPVHFIISGFKGCGKTTLANLIAKELDLEMFYQIGGVFTRENLTKFLVKNQDDKKRIYMLFIDEVHNLSKDIAEYMYPILEDFILPEDKGLKLKPFIFCGATTEKNTLLQKFAPLVDRCGADIVLEQYKSEDIKQILKQYNDKLYQLNITEEVYDILAINTRFTPRIALAFFDDFIVCNDIKRVLDAHRVIKNGLTTTDIAVLAHLKDVGKPVGIEALATNV